MIAGLNRNPGGLTGWEVTQKAAAAASGLKSGAAVYQRHPTAERLIGASKANPFEAGRQLFA